MTFSRDHVPVTANGGKAVSADADSVPASIKIHCDYPDKSTDETVHFDKSNHPYHRCCWRIDRQDGPLVIPAFQPCSLSCGHATAHRLKLSHHLKHFNQLLWTDRCDLRATSWAHINDSHGGQLDERLTDWCA